jgi:hypothetical protein
LSDDLALVWTGAQGVTVIHRPPPGGPPEPIAEGFERLEPVTAEVAGKPHAWLERRVVIRAVQLAQAGERGRRARLANAQAAVAAAVRQLGWRVYVTTQPPEQLSLQEAVLAYRHESRVERAMGRLKGRPLSLTPMYLERDDHATGLIRLLSLGLRVLTWLEFEVRRRVATAKTMLDGLYIGNPTRATARPTAERLLEAFQGLTLTIIREGRRRRRHLTPLSRVHQRILALLDFSKDIYTRLWADSSKPP